MDKNLCAEPLTLNAKRKGIKSIEVKQAKKKLFAQIFPDNLILIHTPG